MSALSGLYAGIIATLGMSLVEYPIWGHRGLDGVAEWRLNQTIVARFSRKPEEDVVVEGLLLHFVHGAIAGLIFGWALTLFPPMISPVLIGLVFGMLLWLISVAITKPITSMIAPPKRSANINVLMHILGYFSSKLTKNEK